MIGRSASGSTITAFSGAGHTFAHTPHPVQTSSRMRGLPLVTSIAPGTGHRSEQTLQKEPVYARHAIGWIVATAIFSDLSLRNTPGLHALMQGVSGHMMHAAVCGSIIGVPAASRKRAGAKTMAPTGHAVAHSPHFVHPARNATSSTAPGGR